MPVNRAGGKTRFNFKTKLWQKAALLRPQGGPSQTKNGAERFRFCYDVSDFAENNCALPLVIFAYICYNDITKLYNGGNDNVYGCNIQDEGSLFRQEFGL